MKLVELAAACLCVTAFYACTAEAPVYRQPDTASAGSAVPTAGLGGRGAPDVNNPSGVVQPVLDASVPAAGNLAMGGNPGSTPATGGSSSLNPTPIPSLAPVVIDDTGANNPAGLSPAEVTALAAGGPVGGLRWLYPYEGTVFPRGMLAPLVMWEGPPADVVYLRIKTQAFDYKSVLKVATAAPVGALVGSELGPQLQIPQHIWDKAGQQTQGKLDPFTVELTARSRGVVAGPIMLHFTIAQATVKGSIYYNTYGSRLSGGGFGGNVARIPPGGQAELFLTGACYGCHSVAANGSRMTTEWATLGGNSYPLVSGGGPNPMGTLVAPRGSFGALYPDGSKVLITSIVIDVAYAKKYQQQLVAPVDATLYDTTTGEVVGNTAVPPGALMPMFSPDSKYLVFNDHAINTAHGLAVMDYDTRTNRATNYKTLIEEPAGNTRPGWPFFLPDSKAVVFVRTDGADFSGSGAGGVAGMSVMPTPASDMSIVDMATRTTTLLAKAMGYTSPADAARNATYLPFGADDLHHNYFPTVSPVAAGGYFWLFFDSLRNYGNLGLQRALWGAAIDIAVDGSYSFDPSHPAFYLSGQEFNTGNHRAFAALDPCEKEGDSCTSTIDCCAGTTCSFENGTTSTTQLGLPVGVCAPPPLPPPSEPGGGGPTCTTCTTCAKVDERCASMADCCDPQNLCINGFCALVVLL